MTSINNNVSVPLQAYGVQQKQSNHQTPVNFKAGRDEFVRSDEMSRMMAEREKEQKKAKRKQKMMTGLQVTGILASIALAGYFIISGLRQGKMMKGDVDLSIQDVTNEKSFKDLILPDELQKVVDDLKVKISRADSLKKKGLKGNNGILLYGKPGGGKNTFVYALTKYYQEISPGSELVMVDVNKFKGMYNGQTENNIISFVETLKKKAAENPNRKLVVFLDEFDSIARKAGGSNSESMESFQNAFKTTLGKIMDIDNVQVIAATNKAEKGIPIEEFLDSAISNRFAEKIHIPLPTSAQIQDSFMKHLKGLPKECVSEELLNAKPEFWNKVCNYITEESHSASYRDFNYILTHAKILSESGERVAGSPISKADLIKAIAKHSENSNWDEAMTNKFKDNFKEFFN